MVILRHIPMEKIQPEFLGNGYPLFDDAEGRRQEAIRREREEEAEEKRLTAIEDSARTNLRNGREFTEKHRREEEGKKLESDRNAEENWH